MRTGLFIILAAIPFLELALLIKVGQSIGFWLTLAIIVGTALLGTYVLSSRSLLVIQRAFDAVQKGKTPVAPVLEGAFVMLAGLLLITPGLISDFLGLALLVPQIRHRTAVFLVRQLLKHPAIRVFVFGGAHGPEAAPSAQPPNSGPRAADWPPRRDQVHDSEGPVIEGEFERLDERTIDPKSQNRGHNRRN